VEHLDRCGSSGPARTPRPATRAPSRDRVGAGWPSLCSSSPSANRLYWFARSPLLQWLSRTTVRFAVQPRSAWTLSEITPETAKPAPSAAHIGARHAGTAVLVPDPDAQPAEPLDCARHEPRSVIDGAQHAISSPITAPAALVFSRVRAPADKQFSALSRHQASLPNTCLCVSVGPELRSPLRISILRSATLNASYRPEFFILQHVLSAV
jgi:hypothetical protein